MALMPPPPAGTINDDPLIGAAIDGRYTVVRRLGAGGMGAVYEAEHVGSGRRVAVKVILGDHLAKNPKLLTRFQREARAAGKVESPHIAQMLDTGVDTATGTPFLVMEYLEGEDLQVLLKRLGPLPVGLALRIVCQALRGLNLAHQAGVVHRDIKPANLFLARTGASDRVVKLLDFGIAKDIDPFSDETGGLTNTGALLGSPLYMSPEQVRNRKQLDHRTDVWSMGIVLFQALVGRTPFQDADSIGDLIMSICSSPVPWLQDVAAWIPADVAAIAQRAIAIEPEQRFATAHTMLEAIVRLLPQGDAIEEAMLVTVDMATRAFIAPRSMTSEAARFTAPVPPPKAAWSSAPWPSAAPLLSPAVANPFPALRAPMASAPSAPELAGAPHNGAAWAAAPPSSVGYQVPGLPSQALPASTVTDAGMAATRGTTAAAHPWRAPIAVAFAAIVAIVGVAGSIVTLRHSGSTPSATTITMGNAAASAPVVAPEPMAPAAAPRVKPPATSSATPEPTTQPASGISAPSAVPPRASAGRAGQSAPSSSGKPRSKNEDESTRK